MEIKLVMKYRFLFSYFVIFNAVISFAQELQMDTLFFEGDYVVRYCCVKKKKAIVDFEKVDDSTAVYRLVFDKPFDKNLDELSKNDTIPFEYQLLFQRGFLEYSYRYLTINLDGEWLMVYRPKSGTYENKKIIFFIVKDDILPDYYIPKKCPRRIIHKPKRWWMRLYRW